MKCILPLIIYPVLGRDEFLSRKTDISARVLQQGWADSSQQQMLLRYASDCFSWNPVDTSTGVGGLQGSLGDATSCVLINLEQRWGWKPDLVGSGSNNGGPYDGYGAGTTTIGVDTPSGKWQFILKNTASDGSNGTPSQAGGSQEGGSESVIVHSLHRGDATSEQETDLIHFTETCFGKHHIDISNVVVLTYRCTLPSVVCCKTVKRSGVGNPSFLCLDLTQEGPTMHMALVRRLLAPKQIHGSGSSSCISSFESEAHVTIFASCDSCASWKPNTFDQLLTCQQSTFGR